MAEFHFYSTREEIPSVFGRLFDDGGFRFLADRNYESSVPAFSPKCDPVFFENVVNGLFFVTGPFTGEPIVLRRILGGNYSGTYTINVQKSGPLLEVSCPTERDIGGLTVFGRGFIGYQPQYWSLQAGCLVPAPSSLKESYTILTNILKRGFRTAMTQRKTVVYLSPGVLDRLRSEGANIRIDGKCLGIGDLDVAETDRTVRSGEIGYT